jgi:glycosyltransferase involved in cell wall biosynthesis
MASPRNGKRRGPAASSTGEGVAAVLAAALEMERTGSAELRPPAALTNDEALDAPAATNGVHWPSDAPANGEPGTGAAGPQNGADISSLDSAAAQHRADRTLQGFIDEATAAAIRGWAWDPKAPGERIRLELVADDVPLLTAIAGEDRPGLVLSGIGDGRHGFDICLADGLLPEGRHVLHLRCAETGAPVPGSPIVIEGLIGVPAADAETDGKAALDGRGATRNGAAEPAGETPSTPSIRPVLESDHLREVAGKDDAPANFRAHLDEVSDTEISGWIMQRDEPSHRCVVALREDERVLARTVASRFRPDLAAAGVGDGCYAFNLAMPRSLLDGEEHLLEIIEEDTGFALVTEPVRWRSTAGTGGIALTGLHSDLAITGPDGLARLPDLEAKRFSKVGRAPYPDSRPTVGRTGSRTSSFVGTRVLFDISDLVYYIGRHPNLTGIQRVQSSIVLSIVGGGLLTQSAVIFLVFNARSRRWMVIPTSYLVSLLRDLFLPEEQRPVSFATDEVRDGILPGAIDFNGAGLLDDGNPSVLCLLGAAWVQRDYFHRVAALKRRFGTKFVMVVHDLIPVYARETCDQDTARVFDDFLRRALRHADHVLSVSENTAKDLQRYARSMSVPVPPITVTRNGSSFDEFLPKGGYAADVAADHLPERFVLFVATVEGRKNHRLILDIWRRMLAEGDDPPHLVCVGRVGWKSEPFVAKLVETGYLDGRVILLQEVSDAYLRLLYSRCLFTVFPSLYEGWGLPVGESLAAGKVCVCSNRASIPEVAGEFGSYIDIEDPDQSYRVVRELVSDEAGRRRLEQKIRRQYQPVTWRSVAERVVDACKTVAKAEWRDPYPYAAIPYSSEISFAWFGGDDQRTSGDELLSRIVDARRGYFLRDPLSEESFLRGEEARAGGIWAEPENWGTWLCQGGGEVVLGLAPNAGELYDVFLRLRASAPVAEQRIRLTANGEPIWEGAIGPQARNIIARIRRRGAGTAPWLLRLGVEVDLSSELRAQIAALDRRVPTIGFERLVVVPENDLKSRVDILYTLLA